ncbi:MAG: tRNA 2-selenouridine(34) synthase MnmH [Syntrophomonadaceae bacterium]|nr:tRNA 2-selenouridine(34) synthase MnmH [Syntrophomonadaceae bacterium]
MIRDIGVTEALNLENAVFVDLRSPVEFNAGHIPGAVNIPLFSDQERSEIGTIYRQQGPGSAREKGLEVVAPRLAEMVASIRKMAADSSVVVYCWRGGERSDAVARVLDIMQVDGYRLAGGYKAYRTFVIERLRELPRSQVVVIHGLTGSGKTEIIKKMAEAGWPAVDLEGLSNHRGSVFGGLGLGEQPKQKQFDSMLYGKLQQFADHRFLIVESESRKIGKLFLPERLYAMMKEGLRVLIYDNMENRVNRIYDEYVVKSGNTTKEYLNCIEGLKRYLGKKKIQEITEMISDGNLRNAIRILLEEYYDPLYGYPCGPDPHYCLNLDGSDTSQAADRLAAYLTNL